MSLIQKREFNKLNIELIERIYPILNGFTYLFFASLMTLIIMRRQIINPEQDQEKIINGIAKEFNNKKLIELIRSINNKNPIILMPPKSTYWPLITSSVLLFICLVASQFFINEYMLLIYTIIFTISCLLIKFEFEYWIAFNSFKKEYSNQENLHIKVEVESSTGNQLCVFLHVFMSSCQLQKQALFWLNFWHNHGDVGVLAGVTAAKSQSRKKRYTAPSRRCRVFSVFPFLRWFEVLLETSNHNACIQVRSVLTNNPEPAGLFNFVDTENRAIS